MRLSEGWPRAGAVHRGRESSLWLCHLSDKGAEAQKGPVTCLGTSNLSRRLQSLCIEIEVNPVRDLPRTARQRHLRRALSGGRFGILSGRHGSRVGAGDFGKRREGCI